MIATNKQPLLLEYGQIGPIFILKYFFLVLNWICLFVFEFITVSGCYFWGFGICKAGYIEHDYAIVAGMLRIEYIACSH